MDNCAKTASCLVLKGSFRFRVDFSRRTRTRVVKQVFEMGSFHNFFKRVVARRTVYHKLNVITISLYVRPSICMCKAGLTRGVGWTRF